MNTGSLELCKELYELSGWEQMEWGYNTCPGTEGVVHNIREVGHLMKNTDSEFICPAYTLGYLLRKLQNLQPDLTYSQSSDWNAIIHPNPTGYNFFAKTPEDAVCKLAIELFKQGVLKK